MDNSANTAAAWGGICCSSPPCLAVSLRKATYTYGNIVERKAFTISVPSESYAREADYIGTVSGRNVDKFVATKLTPVPGSFVDAPYIGESEADALRSGDQHLPRGRQASGSRLPYRKGYSSEVGFNEGTARSIPKDMMLHLPVMGGGDSIIWISHSSRERS